MIHRMTMTLALMLALGATVAVADDAATTTSDQMTALIGMCDVSAAARADRQASESLYDRLGGYDRILALTQEIVRRHQVNPDFKVMMTHIDGDLLARNVADFMAAGTGGTAAYTGRSLPESHAHLRLTDGDFLSAGGDIIGAMHSMDYGQEVIDEVVCVLVSLKDQVVFQ